MQAIWKYQLQVTDEQDLSVPAGARFLSAQIQHGILCIWAIVDVDAPKERRLVKVIGTGHEHEVIDGTFIDSLRLSGGNLIFHVFVV